MIEILRKRRSIRVYEEKPIAPEMIAVLKEALLRSPSSRNIRPWEFLFIEDNILLEKLSRSKPHGAGFLKNAALGIVICGESNVSDVWVEDCSIASIIGHLTAESLGLGSCWIQIRNRDHDGTTTAEAYIRDILGLADNLCIESILAVGYPAKKKAGIAEDDLPWQKVKTIP
ncbi:MAG: nitroreductase family protein [Thermodesulfobacteriota bacterium]|nr:nitroreductase family protein [Thermodesulfobacteriota bacterium]